MPSQQNLLRFLTMLAPQAASIPKRRLGARHDGGYVINDDLRDLDAAISIGIGGEVSFDLDLAQQGVRVFQYDPTIAETPLPHRNFTFRRLGWAAMDGADTRSLAAMLAENQLVDSRDLLLKFDAEDAEWDALATSDPAVLGGFRVIVGELHWLERLEDDGFFERAWQAMAVLTRDHVVTHLHVNNCGAVVVVQGVVIPTVVEISLLRRDRAHFAPSHAPIPGPLDFPNDVTLPDIVLTPFAV